MVAQLEGSSNLPSEDGLFGGDHRNQHTRVEKKRGNRGGAMNRKGNWSGKGTGKDGKNGKSMDWVPDYGKAKGKGNKSKGKNHHGKSDYAKGGKGKNSEIPK